MGKIDIFHNGSVPFRKSCVTIRNTSVTSYNVTQRSVMFRNIPQHPITLL